MNKDQKDPNEMAEKKRFKLAKYFMGIQLKKFEAPASIDYKEIADDSVTAADALITALKTPPLNN